MVIDTSAVIALLLAEPAGDRLVSANFGDCFSYALSVTRGEPLLFVGDDLSQTDVEACPW